MNEAIIHCRCGEQIAIKVDSPSLIQNLITQFNERHYLCLHRPGLGREKEKATVTALRDTDDISPD